MQDALRAPPRHLIYLEEGRTHEVHAEIVPGTQGVSLVTTEFPPGSQDPLEAVQLEEVLPSQARVDARIIDLESRLATAGTYWRADAATMAWAKIQPALVPRVDMRPHEFGIPGENRKIRFHHFHGASRDQLYVSLLRDDQPDRHVLASLDFEFPRIDAATMKIIHPRLAPQLLTSQLAREHIELPRRGFKKLIEAAQYQEAYGNGWQEAARNTFQRATRLILGRRLPAATIVESAREETRVPRDLVQAMESAEVRSAVASFLTPQDESALVRGGEFAVRRWVQQKRRRADHRAQWQLSIVEASLLIQWAESAGRRPVIEEEGAKLLRFAATNAR